MSEQAIKPNDILKAVEKLRWEVPENFRDRVVEDVYAESARIADRNVSRAGKSRRTSWERKVDRLLTNQWTGFPIMILILAAVLWFTIEGANIFSGAMAGVLVDSWHTALKGWSAMIGMPWWLDGVLIDGIYLTTAWVVSVMFPPMAIFFPLFTILEDLGYLPRVAFNLDRLFQRVGAHGKQALTMTMGFGCNAAGVIAARVIDSPRERLIAILTNNFALCNGRWPTQILVATVFLGALVPPALAGFTSAMSVVAVAMLGFVLALLASWFLTKTWLKGEASSFSLELPPYRPPNILRTLYTSFIDRTLFVLGRAVMFAMPAGVAVWIICNVRIGEISLAQYLINGLDPIGWFIGLNGIILLAYIVAVPANEIVVPTILMLTVLVTGMSGVGEQGTGVMFETEGEPLKAILRAGGWTTLTALCMMIFGLCHNPCSTAIYTIWKETRSRRWTLFAVALPVVVGVALCALVAALWRLFF